VKGESLLAWIFYAVSEGDILTHTVSLDLDGLFCEYAVCPYLPHCSQIISMQNEEGSNVDLYVPRKCSYTNRLVRAKDHASVQINVANVDPVTGVMTGESTPYCLAGYIRFKSESDMALTTLVQKQDAQLFGGASA
jgi:small subunit ribosomal protein S21e